MRCQGYQGFPAGRGVAYDFANTGAVCGFLMSEGDDTCAIYLSAHWQETITPSGMADYSCLVIPAQALRIPIPCACAFGPC